ncbi:hypothetical protein HW555_005171 [Spodoptera exigua]|uniref:Tubulin polyglutamylase TTLL2 n=1 Tax=Spodoptera exigua TaxID=7107 RepID=A0A835GKD5_SPOEX|nr:hypothetical protein HW555_005171 [Spodoptera exigua]
MEGSFDDDEPFIFRLNDSGTGPGLLVKVCAERGWRMYPGYHSGLEERWNLWWKTSAFPAASYKTLGDWQFMNHIPKGGSICRKDNLSRLLRCMKRIYGAVYDFSPPCYHLPLEYAKLVSECSRLRRDENGAGANVVWIHKPVAQSQGRGIFLFRSLCEMNCGTSAVVQRYIERPLLIAGYKFDLRLYVCVPGYRPLTAYMYAEGLARFGTDKYTLSDIHNPYRHLTNSSLNKSGPRYAECKDRIGSGCKWTLTQVRKALIGRWGAAEWVVWQRIRALVTLTLLAQATGTPPARNCFEFYGFDVLLDDCLKPWLLEVNLSPALASDCEADVVVKATDAARAESAEKSKEVHGVRFKTDTNSEGDVQSSSSGPTPQTESVDESWRGGYSTAASRRRVMTACKWGNGVCWNRAIGRVGHWIRIYPHSLPNNDELPVEDVRESVAQVSKFVRAAREVSREYGKDTSGPRDASRDAVFEEALRKKLDFGPHFQVWLPPF